MRSRLDPRTHRSGSGVSAAPSIPRESSIGSHPASFDLILAGHLHAGRCLPLPGRRVTLAHPQARFVSGLYDTDGADARFTGHRDDVRPVSALRATRGDRARPSLPLHQSFRATCSRRIRWAWFATPAKGLHGTAASQPRRGGPVDCGAQPAPAPSERDLEVARTAHCRR